MDKLLKKLRKTPLSETAKRGKIALSIADLIIESVAFLDLKEAINNDKDSYFLDLKNILRKEVANTYLMDANKRYICIHTRNINKIRIIADLGFETPIYHFIRANTLIVNLNTLEVVNNFI